MITVPSLMILPLMLILALASQCWVFYMSVCMHVKSLHIGHQALLSRRFSRQKYWSGLPCPLPGDRLNPVIKLASLMSPALAGWLFTTSATWGALYMSRVHYLWPWLEMWKTLLKLWKRYVNVPGSRSTHFQVCCYMGRDKVVYLSKIIYYLCCIIIHLPNQ